jgi:hypothetical protein
MGAPELLRDRTVARNIPLLALSNFDVWWLWGPSRLSWPWAPCVWNALSCELHVLHVASLAIREAPVAP